MKKLVLIAVLLVSPFVWASENEDCIENDTACTISCDGTADNVDFDSAVSDVISGATITVTGTCVFADQIDVIDKSVIFDGTDKSTTSIDYAGDVSKYVIEIDVGSAYTQVWTNFTFTDSVARNKHYFKINGDYSPDGNFLIDDCIFTDIAGRIADVDTVYGVFSNLTVTGLPGQFMFVHAEDATTWARDMDYGTANAVYIETSNITGDGGQNDSLFDGDEGARVVVRHNIFNNVKVGTNHGNEDTEGNRGMMLAEIYGNEYTADGVTYAIGCSWRSGVLLFYDNEFKAENGGGWTKHLLFKPYNACPASAPVGCADRSTNHEDPRDLTYPLQDQPGRGTNQRLEPVHIWGNGALTIDNFDYGCDDCTGSGGTRTATNNCDDESDCVDTYIELNYDYYYSADATAQKLYTPYQYPHPLRDFVATSNRTNVNPDATGSTTIDNTGTGTVTVQ